MNKHFVFAPCAALTALLATGFGVMSEPADAQQYRDADEVVVVEAPIQRQTVGRDAVTGARTEIIELSRQVSYADLDLTRSAHVDELEKRIETTAREACEKLEQMFPLPRLDPVEFRRCIKQAVASAEEGLQAAIAEAG